MARKITDVTLKGGVLNISNRIANDIGRIATLAARRRQQQRRQDQYLANQLLRGVQPAKNTHPLITIPASQTFNNVVSSVVAGANSGDPNWVINANQNMYSATEQIASLSSVSDNLKAADEVFEDKNIWKRPDARKLQERMNTSDRWDQDFMKKMVDDPLPSVFDYNTGRVNVNALGAEDIDIDKSLKSLFSSVSATESYNPINIGDGQVTKKVVPLRNSDADAFRMDGGLDPNLPIPTIESVVDNSLMNNSGFIEQYVDKKNIQVADPLNLTDQEKVKVKESLLNEGIPYVEQQYQSVGGVKIYNSIGDKIKDKPYGFSLNFTTYQTDVNVAGKNVEKQSPLFGIIKPNKEKFTIPNYRGSINRDGQPYSGAKIDGNLTALTIKPFKIKNKKDYGLFTDEDIKKASGFKIYYEFEGGDVYVPLSSKANLNWSMGSKQNVGVKQSALDQITDAVSRMNEYHKKVKNGTIKDPVMYEKYKEYASGKITADEFSAFMKDFNFDR